MYSCFSLLLKENITATWYLYVHTSNTFMCLYGPHMIYTQCAQVTHLLLNHVTHLVCKNGLHICCVELKVSFLTHPFLESIFNSKFTLSFE